MNRSLIHNEMSHFSKKRRVEASPRTPSVALVDKTLRKLSSGLKSRRQSSTASQSKETSPMAQFNPYDFEQQDAVSSDASDSEEKEEECVSESQFTPPRVINSIYAFLPEEDALTSSESDEEDSDEYTPGGKRKKPSSSSRKKTKNSPHQMDMFDEDPRDPRHEESVRTGVYVVHPTGNSESKRQGRLQANTNFGQIFDWEGESGSSIAQRSVAFKKAWSIVESEVQTIIHTMNQKSFEKVRYFLGHESKQLFTSLQESLSRNMPDVSLTSSHIPFPLHHVEIPTALVFVEGSLADQSFLFKQLATYLKQTPLYAPFKPNEDGSPSLPEVFPPVNGLEHTMKPFVAVVDPKSFTQGYSCLRTIVTKLITSYPVPVRKRDIQLRAKWRSMLLDVDYNARKLDKQLKEPIQRLVSWYFQHLPQTASEQKEEDGLDDEAVACDNTESKVTTRSFLERMFAPDMSAAARRPLFVVFEDVESCKLSALAEVLELFQTNPLLISLGVVFVFGMSTYTHALHKLLPATALTSLRFESLCLQPSQLCLEQIFDRLIVGNRSPVHLGQETMQFLLDLFFLHDFSIETFVQALRFVILVHFDGTPFSQLCDFDVDISLVRGLASDGTLNTLADKCISLDGVNASPSPEYICKCLERIRTHRRYFPMWFGLLHDTCCMILPQFKRDAAKRRDIFMALLETRTSEVEEISKLRLYIKNLPLMDLQPLLDMWLRSLLIPDMDCKLDEVTLAHVADAMRTVEGFIEALYTVEHPSEDHSTPDPPKLERKPSKGSYANRRNAMLAEARAAQDKVNPLRLAIADWFLGLCDARLAPLSTFPLHDVFNYNERSNKLMNMFRPCFRTAVHTALVNSSVYLGNTEVEYGSGYPRDAQNKRIFEPLQPDVDDVGICYQLYLEAPKRIELIAWFHAYCAVMTQNIKHLDQVLENQRLKQTLQARFLRAVQTLKAFGLIAATRGKQTDEFVDKISFIVPE